MMVLKPACAAGVIVFARESCYSRETNAEGARGFQSVSSLFSTRLRSSSIKTFLVRTIPPGTQAILKDGQSLWVFFITSHGYFSFRFENRTVEIRVRTFYADTGQN